MAGGPITVTDRISVRVTAKNQEQSASQKRDVGGSIAKTLGNGNVSDSLKDQLGNTKNPVITDENGDTWVSMEDMIDAGKTMNSNGAFPKDMYTADLSRFGFTGNISVAGVSRLYAQRDGSEIMDFYGSAPIFGVLRSDGSNLVVFSSQEFGATLFYSWANPPVYWNDGADVVHAVPSSKTANGITYTAYIGGVGYNPDFGPRPSVIDPLPSGVTIGDVAFAVLYGGTTQQAPGSIIDWTKPDNEIDPQIHELFETMRTKEGKDYVKVAIATESSGESGSGDSGSGGGHTGGDF